MGLFNFIAFRLSSQPAIHDIMSQEPLNINSKEANVKGDILYIKPVNKKSSFADNIFYNEHSLSSESAYHFAKLHTDSIILFKDLINKYWQQTIFLSLSNTISNKYVTKLAKQNSIITKSNKKRLVINFSKALLREPSSSSIVTGNLLESSKTNYSVKYTWRKGLNLKVPKYFNGLWSNKRAPSYPNKFQTKLLQGLSNSNLPLYVVVNGFKQMVIGEPTNQLSSKNAINNNFYQWYYDRFLWERDDNTVYEGWFFVNPQDALEYKNFIETKYSRSSNQSGLGIIPSKLGFYYRLNRTSPPRTEFRLFPDLEEIGNILHTPKYKQHLVFDKRQLVGRSYFQGQPIYFIEPITSRIKGSKKAEVLNYYYQVPSDSSFKKYTGVFLNKQIAVNAWQQFAKQMSDYKLPSSPTLRVYNLEDFLKDCESQNSLESFLIVPGNDSYNDILYRKVSAGQSGQYQNVEGCSSPYILTCKLWVQRLLWSLTSRQPPNW